LRGIKALARRYSIKILATSQKKPPVFFEALEGFEFGMPSENLKRIIAAKASPVLSDSVLQVLSTVHTGLEANLVGEMQARLEKNTTRLNLLDQYIRSRLGKNARIGSSAFRYFATYLLEKLAFSASESEFDIRMIEKGFSAEDCDALFDSGILVSRSGRVSFAHEMYYYACASHSYAVEAVNDPDTVGKMLNKPIYTPLACDVISAIEDERAVLLVLRHITNAKLLADAADGDLGEVAKSAAVSLLNTALERVISDIQSAGLEFQTKDGVTRLDWDSFTKVECLSEERAQYQALGIRVGRGKGVEAYLALCRAMDERLGEERVRLREEANKARVGLKSDSFQLAYLGFGSRISFNFLAGATKNYFKNKTNHSFPNPKSLTTLSSGELYFFLEHAFEWDYIDELWFVEELIKVIENRYLYEPYHVQLSILDSAQSMGRHEQKVIDRLINAIESLDIKSIWMNSIVIDVLKGLGALDESAEAARATIKEQINVAAHGEDNNDTFESALSIYVSRFDHPFDWIFYEELDCLAPELVHKLYLRALQAPTINQSMSKASLIIDVFDFQDKDDLSLISRFTKLPAKNSFFPQDEVTVFVLAISFLANYNYPLPAVEIIDERDYCFNAFRKIIYGMHSNRPAAKEEANNAWQALEASVTQQSIAVLYEVVVDGRGPYRSKVLSCENLLKIYFKEVLSLARQFMRFGQALDFSHSYRYEEATSFAFYLVGALGDRGDLGRLRELSSVSELSSAVLSAIKSIEEK
jgi:hypothetical protein